MKRFKSTQYDKIYISKGGVITGEYIRDARIDELEEILDNYVIPKTIKVPISTIFVEKDNCFIPVAILPSYKNPELSIEIPL